MTYPLKKYPFQQVCIQLKLKKVTNLNALGALLVHDLVLV